MPRAARRRAAFAALATVAIAVLGAAGCTLGPSDRPAVAVRDPAIPPAPPRSASPGSPALPPPLVPGNPAALEWADCTAEIVARLDPPPPGPPGPYQCAELSVDPNAGGRLSSGLRLGLLRAGTGDVPLVVVGDIRGEPGTLRAARLATAMPRPLLDTFAVIGLDRRGSGPADPVACVPQRARERVVGFDPDGREAGQLAAVLDTARSFIQTCIQELDITLTLLDSAGTADDLEQLRLTLDAPRLNVLAFGEGSRSVLRFLERYPRSAGRIVLDGAPDPTLDGIGAAEAVAGATEAAFAVFAGDCASRPDCPLAPDPRAALLALADALRAAPLTGPDGLQVTAGTAFQAVLEALPEPGRWPQLAAALAAAANRDPTGVVELVRPVLTEVRGTPARFDPRLATGCNDTPTRVPPARAGQLLGEWRDRFPTFGPLMAQRLLLCSSWPVPNSGPPPQAPRTPPTLVIATAIDPLSSPTGAQRTVEQLSSAVLVNWQGAGHGAFPRTPCVTDLVTRYLVDGIVPAPNTLCPP